MMLKYLNFVSIILFTLFRKVFGLFWFWLAVHFRGWARNVVYNYTLENKIWIKRLYERQPTNHSYYYTLNGEYITGTVAKMVTCWLEFKLAYWFVWGWLDDDANYDVTDVGYIETYLSGERKTLFSLNKLEEEVKYLKSCKFGNTFDLGDLRSLNPIELKHCWRSVLLWNKRNTSYNFKYSMYETIDKEETFIFTYKGKVFGWVPEDIVAGEQNYSLRFFEGR